MKRSMRWITGLFVALLLGALIAASVVLFRQMRQDSLDRALLVACRKLDAPTVIRLLNEGANPNAKETKGPLTLNKMVSGFIARFRHRAIGGNSDDEYSALCLVFVNHEFTPAHSDAADTIAVSLIEHGAECRVPWKGYTLIYLVVDTSLHRTLSLLLSGGESVDQTNMRGKTLLMSAVDADDVDGMKILLKHRANVNAVDSRGLSAACYASESLLGMRRQEATMHLLIQTGAKLSKADRYYLAGEHIPIPPELRGK